VSARPSAHPSKQITDLFLLQGIFAIWLEEKKLRFLAKKVDRWICIFFKIEQKSELSLDQNYHFSKMYGFCNNWNIFGNFKYVE